MAKVCCVCSDLKETQDNRLFRCGGQGCGIIVHQACYGIVTIPTGLWFCRKCESQERAARVKCELCPKKDGALKRTDAGNWAHVVCALYIPEVTFGNLRTMEPIITTKLPKERFSKMCYICEELGHENQASTGACMSCHKSNCRLTFHVTCAQKEQLLVEEEDPRDTRNIIYCGYCATHYKRMLKQKLKQQNIRKQGLENVATLQTTESISTTTTPSTAQPPYSLGNLSMVQEPSITFSPSLPVTSPSISALSKHLTSSKAKDNTTDRTLKRTSSDAGLPSSSSSSKRKYRRRKLSSSNDSSTSEALSSTNEVPLRSVSPTVAGASPSPVHKKLEQDEIDRSSEMIMDCGNLDLLASVTQNVDQVNRIGKVEPIGLAPCGGRLEKSYSPSSSFMSPPVSSEPNAGTVGGASLSGDRPAKVEPAPKENTKRGGNPVGKVSNKKRKSSTATANSRPVTDNSIQANSPPLSLHELLERQWEQTAQFILDQAGRQNNGVMLAHLHKLQSENRVMQARIMELASQREFFIATNARLQQTLNEGSINKVINGIQILSSDGGRSLLTTAHQEPVNGDSNRNLYSDGLSLEAETPPTSVPVAVSNGNQWNHSNSTLDHHHQHHYHHHILQDGVLEQYPRNSRSSLYVSASSSAPFPSSYGLTATGNDVLPLSRLPLPHEVTHVTNTVQGPIAAYTGFTNAVRVTSPSSSHRHST